MSHEMRLREDIAGFAKSLFDRGYTAGSSGNISAICDDAVLISPTNSCLGFLDPARISKINRDGRHVSGDLPSKEVILHLAFYETRPGTGAVVHLHSTYATLLSCLTETNPENTIPPLTPYVVMRVGRVPLLPYAPPGDSSVGAMIRALGGSCAAVLLANHGPVVSGKDLPSAVYASEELEETAKLSILAQGRRANLLTPDQISDLDGRFSLR
ncbi:AraD Ribulose-5-phosphate 4-epimerase and related epimerases and aldolases [Rhabdaerophilaceae bacterium]